LLVRKLPTSNRASLTPLGMTVGLILRISNGTSIQNLVIFNDQIFFNLLLPPIILASGYELHQANFFRNIGSILTFAFAGTFISAIVLGLILWVYTRIPIDGFSMTFVDAISVGATLSATDPVTILAIFNTYKVDPKLYTVIFGESILNDAVAIVLFETAQRYKEGGAAGTLSFLSLIEGIGIFLAVFFGSLIIGVVVGIGTALALKYTYVRRFPKIESCLIVLISYASYFFSNGLHMSGKLSSTSFTCSANPFRNRHTSFLWNHAEALCLLQHVPPNTTHHQIPLPGPRPTVGKFYLHLPGTFPLHRDSAGIQTVVHHCNGDWHLCCTMVCSVPAVQSYQLVYQI